MVAAPLALQHYQASAVGPHLIKIRILQICSRPDGPAAARFDAAMILAHGFDIVVGATVEVLGLLIGKGVHLTCMQLVPLDRQDVIRPLIPKFLGNTFLAPSPRGCPVIGHDAAFQCP